MGSPASLRQVSTTAHTGFAQLSYHASCCCHQAFRLLTSTQLSLLPSEQAHSRNIAILTWSHERVTVKSLVIVLARLCQHVTMQAADLLRVLVLCCVHQTDDINFSLLSFYDAEKVDEGDWIEWPLDSQMPMGTSWILKCPASGLSVPHVLLFSIFAATPN